MQARSNNKPLNNAAPIDRSVIEACALSVGSAPSGAHHQPWHFVCVGEPATKRAIREAAEEERAFYGGKAGTVWLNDLMKIGSDAYEPFFGDGTLADSRLC